MQKSKKLHQAGTNFEYKKSILNKYLTKSDKNKCIFFLIPKGK